MSHCRGRYDVDEREDVCVGGQCEERRTHSVRHCDRCVSLDSPLAAYPLCLVVAWTGPFGHVGELPTILCSKDEEKPARTTLFVRRTAS